MINNNQQENNPPGEQGGEQFNNPRFLTLPQVDISGLPPSVNQKVRIMWKSVCQILEDGEPVGTGFLVMRPSIEVHIKDERLNGPVDWTDIGKPSTLILTNRHVISDINNPKRYSARFFYELGVVPVTCPIGEIHAYGEVTETTASSLEKNQLDFVLASFSFDKSHTEQDKMRILELAAIHLEEGSQFNALYQEGTLKFLKITNYPLYAIGHPRVGYKKFSRGTLLTPPTPTNSSLEHSIDTRPGSSGSPIFPYPHGNIGGSAIAMHFCAGYAIVFQDAIMESVRRQFKFTRLEFNTRQEFTDWKAQQ